MDIRIGNVLVYSLTMLLAVEQALPQNGLGQTKKQIVLNGIDTALKATSSVSAAVGHNDVATYTSIASAFIDSTVSLLNKAKSTPFVQHP